MSENEARFDIKKFVDPFDSVENTINEFEKDLDETLIIIKNILCDKNRKYGNSALDPKRIFSKADPIEQLKVRIDDKISRLENQQNDDDEDAEFDLLGYLILLRMARTSK